MENKLSNNEQPCTIHSVMHSLCYQPTHIKIKVEGRMFLVKAPINWYDTTALYYAGIMSLLDKKHSFDYYMWCAFESNCA